MELRELDDLIVPNTDFTGKHLTEIVEMMY